VSGERHVLSAEDRERLRLLARHKARLETPDFAFGSWMPSRTDAGGVIHLGWYQLSPEAEALLSDVRAGSWVQPFDWQAWMASPEGMRLTSEADAVATASVQDLEHLLTAIVRSERFTDGSIAGAFESGLLTAIVRRAGELLEA
jgi:hypothetical protein